MLTSIAIILLFGLLVGWIFSKAKLPSLLGVIIVGIVLSPHGLNLVDESILTISGDLRQIALVIILTRAGLSLNFSDLKKIGRPAILMCFVPACIEMMGTIIFAPLLLGVSILDAAIIGSVMAAVSPAVVVPRMIKLIEDGYGTDKSIPQLILAGASVDDVFVIVMFTALTTLASTGEVSAISFIQIPTSILLGVLLGGAVGTILVWFFRRFHIRDSVKVLIILSVSFLLLELQNRLEGIVPVSGLLAIMSMGIIINQKNDVLAKRLSVKYNKLWLGAEIFLFVLVGIAVDLKYALAAGVVVILLVILALLFRMMGVAVSLVKTKLNKKECLFCMVAYTPKATVQAVLGTVPLAMGLSCGEIVLTVAVISILITAPFGAICVDNLYKKLLSK
ncbi:MAG: cation:proton antiporter [Treponema sp.]|nr:cation:proton antiporter [Treponema sp.]MDY5837234.1 cation:proton antiporter [Treponema sp.]